MCLVCQRRCPAPVLTLTGGPVDWSMHIANSRPVMPQLLEGDYA